MNILFVDPSLRSTGLFGVIDGKYESSTFQTASDHNIALGEIAHFFINQSMRYDALVIEDYAFSKASQSVSKNAEVGGIIRGAFSMLKKPVFEMPISTWKSITGVRLKKVSAKEKRLYIETVSALADRNFGTTDACDAWMIYYATKWILENEVTTQAQWDFRLKLNNAGIDKIE